MKANKILSEVEKEFSLRIDQSHRAMVIEAMNNFAKLHVKAALENATKNIEYDYIEMDACSDHTPYMGACSSCGCMYMPTTRVKSVKIDSILNAYNLDQITK